MTDIPTTYPVTGHPAPDLPGAITSAAGGHPRKGSAPPPPEGGPGFPDAGHNAFAEGHGVDLMRHMASRLDEAVESARCSEEAVALKANARDLRDAADVIEALRSVTARLEGEKRERVDQLEHVQGRLDAILKANDWLDQVAYNERTVGVDNQVMREARIALDDAIAFARDASTVADPEDARLAHASLDED